MKIDEKVTIPLYWVFTGLPALVVSVMWISTIAAKEEANAARIERVSTYVQQNLPLIKEDISKTREDIAAIKVALKLKE